jgi:hypothetical protein
MLQGHGRTSHTPLPYRTAVGRQYSVASFTVLRVLSCLHLFGLRCSCCNVVRFCCDLEACSLVTATFHFARENAFHIVSKIVGRWEF